MEDKPTCCIESVVAIETDNNPPEVLPTSKSVRQFIISLNDMLENKITSIEINLQGCVVHREKIHQDQYTPWDDYWRPKDAVVELNCCFPEVEITTLNIEG